MNLYLVRHGKTGAKESNKQQTPTLHLSEEGRLQAIAVAKRLEKEKIDVVISSKWCRAFETAAIISKRIGLDTKTSEWIHEKKYNPCLYEVDLDSRLFMEYLSAAKKFEKDLDWRFDGAGESTRDLIVRVRKFQNYLIKNYINQNVLVVSHGLFIRAFIILAILGEKYDDDIFYQIYTSISINNAGVSYLDYSIDRNRWGLIYFNDHLHVE
jgi:broad specificity phosphatase PhoE